MTDLLIAPEFVDLDLAAVDRHAATAHLAGLLAAHGRITDLPTFLADVRARETQMPTGIEGGIGIPHARSTAVTVPTLGFGRSAAGIDFGAADGPAHLIFLIAAPEGGGSDHMTILAALARRLIHRSFRESLLEAESPQAVVDLVDKEVLGR